MVASISQFKRPTDIGLWLRQSGSVTIDTRFPKPAKMIRAVVGGDMLVEGLDGQLNFLEGIAAGEWLFFECLAVLSSGVDWEGNARTTTATNIWWYSGDVK